MNENDCRLLDKLLGREGIGARLLAEWHDIATLTQNIDAAQLTDHQREILRAVSQVKYIREEPDSVHCPSDIARSCADLQFETQEQLIVLCLDRRNHIMLKKMVYRGNLGGTQVRVCELFRDAVIRNSSAIVMIHNHPSGDPTPSPDDVAVTRAAKSAGKLLDIEVLDHVVIGAATEFTDSPLHYVSLKERGLMDNL